LVTDAPRCGVHSQQHQRSTEQRRGSAHVRGYDRRWDRYGKARLWQFPLCEICRKEGMVVAATLTDHIVAHKGDMTLFWDPANHQSSCLPCNSRKAVKKEGGFGR
jgi:5-methylcytosine-specific restriction protein A